MASGLATVRSSSKIAVDICKVAFFMVSLYLLIFFCYKQLAVVGRCVVAKGCSELHIF